MCSHNKDTCTSRQYSVRSSMVRYHFKYLYIIQYKLHTFVYICFALNTRDRRQDTLTFDPQSLISLSFRPTGRSEPSFPGISCALNDTGNQTKPRCLQWGGIEADQTANKWAQAVRLSLHCGFFTAVWPWRPDLHGWWCLLHQLWEALMR